MFKMPIVDLEGEAGKLAASGKRVNVLWQYSESIGFLARGREYRSEFHVNPSDEVMLMVRGTMHLHYRTPEGKEEVAVIPEGATIFTPGGIPHSPRFPPDAFALITERRRKEGETDEFHWYCPNCDAFLHRETFVVSDYTADPVSKAYARFFESKDFRTCKSCGNTMDAPEEFTKK
jgi:3-hydroxyanthranilate 3,4-dioxygenase